MKLFIKILLLFVAFQSQGQIDAQKRNDYINQGNQYFRTKDYKKAREQYQKALEIDKSISTIYFNIALTYAKLDDEKKAIEIADLGLKNCTEDLASLYRIKATSLVGIGEYEAALPLFHKTLLLSKEKDYNAIYNLGYNYYMLEKWDNAILYLNDYLESGEEEEGNLDEALFYIGTSYFEKKDFEKAMKYLDQAIEKNPYYTYIFNKAATLAATGNENEALKLINSAISDKPNNAVFYYKKYQILMQINQIPKANEAIKKAYRLDPNEPDLYLDLGTVYHHDNQIDSAKYFYRKSFLHKSSRNGAYCNMANLYARNKITHDSATYYYQKAIIDDPKKASTYYNFGNFYKDLEQYDTAIGYYKKTIELDSEFASAYTNMSIMYAEKKDRKKAIYYALESLKIRPDDYSTNALATDLFFEDKNYENVIKYSTNAIRLDDDGYFKKKLLKYRGLSRQQLGEYNNAINDYLEMMHNLSDKNIKENSEIYGNIGYCYLETDQYQNAKTYFDTALKFTNDIDIWIGIFTINYLNKDSSFKASYNEALKIDKRLKKGMAGINELEKEGYYYTPKHKAILEKIFSKN